jgi:hypothetical protein
MVWMLARRASKLELLHKTLVDAARGETSPAGSSHSGDSQSLMASLQQLLHPLLSGCSDGGDSGADGGANGGAWPAAGAATESWLFASNARGAQHPSGGILGSGMQPQQPQHQQHQQQAAGVGGGAGDGEDDAAAHLASCRIPHCRRCAYELRLLKLRSEQRQQRHQQQQQWQPPPQPQQPLPPWKDSTPLASVAQQQTLPGVKHASSSGMRALHSPPAVSQQWQRVRDILDSEAAEGCGRGFCPAADAMAALQQRQRPDGGFAGAPLPPLQQHGGSMLMSVLEAVLGSMPVPLPVPPQGLQQGQTLSPPSTLPPLPAMGAAAVPEGAGFAALG